VRLLWIRQCERLALHVNSWYGESQTRNQVEYSNIVQLVFEKHRLEFQLVPRSVLVNGLWLRRIPLRGNGQFLHGRLNSMCGSMTTRNQGILPLVRPEILLGYVPLSLIAVDRFAKLQLLVRKFFRLLLIDVEPDQMNMNK
jgi:hypothetical protein